VVDQALGMASITQPSGASRVEPVAVSEIVDSVIAAMLPQLVEAKIKLESHVAPDVPRILADPESVRRCLTNLIENSVKYATAGGLIVLLAQATRHSGRPVVELTVEDGGPGIEEDEADSVFEPFFRGRSARLSRQPGSGLGLAIVKGAIERQGGSIELEPAFPHGCRFRLFFDAETEGVPSSTAREVAT
jgi:signal transduction histidine kinase